MERLDLFGPDGPRENDLEPHPSNGFLQQATPSYKPGDPYEFPESDLIDWVIRKPDGSEEGNVVGKFLDTYKP